MIEQLISLCNSHPKASVESFVDAFDGLATKSKVQKYIKFLRIETCVKIKLNQTLSTLNHRHCRKQPVLEFEDECIERKEEQDVSTLFVQAQKYQLIALQYHLERYCNVLPALGVNSAKYDINLIRSYLLLLLVNERGIESIVIKKVKAFVFFSSLEMFSYLIFFNVFGGATNPDSFSKACKASETKKFFPNEWFNDPEKLNSTQFPPYENFFSELRSNNHLQKD